MASDDLYCYLLHVYWSVCFTTYSRQAWLIENIQCTSIFALRSFDGPPWRCERRKSVRGEYCLRRLRREVSTIASFYRSDIASILVIPGLSIKLQILDLSLNNQRSISTAMIINHKYTQTIRCILGTKQRNETTQYHSENFQEMVEFKLGAPASEPDDIPMCHSDLIIIINQKLKKSTFCIRLFPVYERPLFWVGVLVCMLSLATLDYLLDLSHIVW